MNLYSLPVYEFCGCVMILDASSIRDGWDYYLPLYTDTPVMHWDSPHLPTMPLFFLLTKRFLILRKDIGWSRKGGINKNNINIYSFVYSMSGTLLRALHWLSYIILTRPFQVDTVIIPIWRMRTLRLRDANWLA